MFRIAARPACSAVSRLVFVQLAPAGVCALPVAESTLCKYPSCSIRTIAKGSRAAMSTSSALSSTYCYESKKLFTPGPLGISQTTKEVYITNHKAADESFKNINREWVRDAVSFSSINHSLTHLQRFIILWTDLFLRIRSSSCRPWMWTSGLVIFNSSTLWRRCASACWELPMCRRRPGQQYPCRWGYDETIMMTTLTTVWGIFFSIVKST